ncbi:MAG TPA: hypothetical protein VFB62_10335 [Polyangiaceae bacterium]|jgi:hypothetical protein|nr:hypothetical protein [Polyangiaceae bacterium]
MRWTAMIALAIVGCGSTIVEEGSSGPPSSATSSTAGAGGQVQSSGAAGSPEGGSAGGHEGGAGGGTAGCPRDAVEGEPCFIDMQWCPSSASCSGVLVCVRGKFTLIHPC